MKSFSRNTFDRTFALFRKHPWLNDRPHSEDAFWHIIDHLCCAPEQKQLIHDLLDRFVYLRYNVLLEHIERIVTKIYATWGLPNDNTQVVASHQATDPDSSQWLLQAFKPYIQKAGIANPKLLNNLSKVKDYLPERHNIVIVDEFSGTGKTMVNRIDDVRKRCEESIKHRGLDIEVSVHVCLVAAMEQAIERLSGN